MQPPCSKRRTMPASPLPGVVEEENTMKATALLRADHTAVKKLFREFDRTTTRAKKTRQELVAKIAEELEIHATIEEETFYPAVDEIRQAHRLVEEAHDEHATVKALVAEIQGMDPTSEELSEKVRELRDNVLHHATEEQDEMFPMAERLGSERLEELGEQMNARKRELKKSVVARLKRAVKGAARKVA